MPVYHARAAPPPPSDDPIAPHQLWSHLSRAQQHQARQVLIGVAQQLVTHLPRPLQPKETTHDSHSQPESRQTHSRTSRA
jgi:hypothetical protein